MSETTTTPPAAPAGGKTNGLAVTSLVLGIVGLVIGWLLAPLFLVTSIAGLVLGVIALKQIKQKSQSGKGLAIGGVVTSAIATFITLIFSIFILLAFLAIGSAVDELEGDLEDSSSIFDDQPAEVSEAELDEATEIDGVSVTVSNLRDYKSDNQFIKPESGNKFINIDIALVNNGDDTAQINPFQYYIKDESGAKYDYTSSATKDYTSLSGDLLVGDKLSGTLGFEVPTDAKGLTLYVESHDVFSDSVIKVDLGV